MFKKIIKKIKTNPLDKLLIKAVKKEHKTFLLGWNRGLGDIPLGLWSIVKRIKWFVPDAKITFMIRSNLLEGFNLLPEVKTIIASNWKRGVNYSVKDTLKKINVLEEFDVIIEKPDPSYWVKWQLGKVVPRLNWEKTFDEYYKKHNLDKQITYIAIQTHNDTKHSPWREWRKDNWIKLFSYFDTLKDVKAILLGKDKKTAFNNKCIIDLRNQTTLLEALSIIKNKCLYAILPDGGILSLLYYLDVSFPINVISLWGDCQGVLKQNVNSPNVLLKHFPIIKNNRNVNEIKVEDVLNLMHKKLDLKKINF